MEDDAAAVSASLPDFAVTPRLASAFRVAIAEAHRTRSERVGVEHLFLAILKDPSSLPALLTSEAGMTNDLVQRIEAILGSDGYLGESNRLVKDTGETVGYAVKDEAGDMMVVYGDGTPVASTTRRPVPLFHDSQGRPVWAYEGPRRRD